jgi:shikimate dehydrogenase
MSDGPGRLVLLGQPVAHSLSPTFQNAALAAAGLSARYDAIAVSADALPEMLRQLVRDGAAGNVTIPHKERVAALCEVRTPLATRLRAVNTWWSVNGILHGDNTDVGGFDDAVRDLLGELPVRAHVAVLGAGGAARAVLAAISAWEGCSVGIWSRHIDKSEAIAELGPTGRTRAEEFMAHALLGADLVVNATPIGLLDDAVPVNPAVLRSDAACLDLVYRRSGPTPFVQLARQQGRRADDGMGMLIGQGARAFERWFGTVPDRAVMWRSVRSV